MTWNSLIHLDSIDTIFRPMTLHSQHLDNLKIAETHLVDTIEMLKKGHALLDVAISLHAMEKLIFDAKQKLVDEHHEMGKAKRSLVSNNDQA
jgi:hypothetical protein